MRKYLVDGDYVVIPDLQCPYHDRKVTAAVTRFVADYRPAGLLCVGDESDSPEPSRWNKGTAGEYADTFEAGLQVTHDVLAGFVDALNGGSEPKPFILSRSNHADRVAKYLARYAPALARSSWNNYERIMGYAQPSLLKGREGVVLPLTFSHRPIQFARGWVMMHGDESGMSQTAGGTALGLARKTGQSVVCGHTHRAGVQHFNAGHSGRLHTQLTGVEVGHLMDMGQAGYLGFGAANWQQAFAILRIRSGVVHPQLVFVRNRKFVVEGTEYVA